MREHPRDTGPWAPVRQTAARVGALAVLVLAIALSARLAGLPDLRTAAALALSVGLGGALVASLPARPRIAALWSDLTAWIGLAFVIASTWNALWTGVTSATGIDLGLAVAVQVAAFGMARAARRAAAVATAGD